MYGSRTFVGKFSVSQPRRNIGETRIKSYIYSIEVAFYSCTDPSQSTTTGGNPGTKGIVFQIESENCPKYNDAHDRTRADHMT